MAKKTKIVHPANILLLQPSQDEGADDKKRRLGRTVCDFVPARGGKRRTYTRTLALKITRSQPAGEKSQAKARCACWSCEHIHGFRFTSFPECFCSRAKLTYNNEVVLSVRSKAISPMHVCAGERVAWICERVRASVYICITGSAALITTVRLRDVRNLINDVYISMARLHRTRESHSEPLSVVCLRSDL